MAESRATSANVPKSPVGGCLDGGEGMGDGKGEENRKDEGEEGVRDIEGEEKRKAFMRGLERYRRLFDGGGKLPYLRRWYEAHWRDFHPVSVASRSVRVEDGEEEDEDVHRPMREHVRDIAKQPPALTYQATTTTAEN